MSYRNADSSFAAKPLNGKRNIASYNKNANSSSSFINAHATIIPKSAAMLMNLECLPI